MKYVPEHEALEMYRDCLDDCNDLVVVCGMSYNPSRVLEELDPIAFNCGFNDYCDSMDITTDEDEADEESEEE